jgi:ABC-2 type transport system permease protein
VLVVVLLSGLAALASFVGTGHDDAGWNALGQALAELPAALTLVVGAAVLVALLPRVSIALTWAVFALAVVIALFGELLQLSKAVRSASPYSNVPSIPIDDWGPTVILIAVDAVLVVLAALLMRRRELSS